METLIVQPGSEREMEVLKAFLGALKIAFRTSSEAVPKDITNPETLRRINAYETGKSTPIKRNLEDLKTLSSNA